MDLFLRVLQIVMPVGCLVGGALLPAWVKSVIRSELRDTVNKVDDCDGRLASMEQWRLMVASDVHSIPPTNAILGRLEETLGKLDETLREIRETFGERLARVEERTKHRLGS